MSSAGLLASHSTLAVIIVNTHLFGRHWLTCSLCIHPVHCYRWVQNFFGVPSQHRDVRKWQARRRTIHTRRNFVSNNFGYFRRGLGEDVCVCVCVCVCSCYSHPIIWLCPLPPPEPAYKRGSTEPPRAVARQASEMSVSSTTANMADPGAIKPHVWQLAYHAVNTFAQPVSGLACQHLPYPL